MSIKLTLVKIINIINGNYFSKKFKTREGFKFNKDNLYNWMNLSKKERFNLSKRDSMTYLTERKNLLNKIRNEYKDIIEKN